MPVLVCRCDENRPGRKETSRVAFPVSRRARRHRPAVAASPRRTAGPQQLPPGTRRNGRAPHLTQKWIAPSALDRVPSAAASLRFVAYGSPPAPPDAAECGPDARRRRARNSAFRRKRAGRRLPTLGARRVATAGTSRRESSCARGDPGKAVNRYIYILSRFASGGEIHPSCRRVKVMRRTMRRRTTTARWRRTRRTEWHTQRVCPRGSCACGPRVRLSRTRACVTRTRAPSANRSDGWLGKDRRPSVRDGRDQRACTGASGPSRGFRVWTSTPGVRPRA